MLNKQSSSENTMVQQAPEQTHENHMLVCERNGMGTFCCHFPLSYHYDKKTRAKVI